MNVRQQAALLALAIGLLIGALVADSLGLTVVALVCGVLAVLACRYGEGDEL